MFIQDISSPKPKVNTSASNMEVFDLWESDEDDAYSLTTKVSDDGFWEEGEEEDVWGEEDQATVQYLTRSERNRAKDVP